MIRFDSVIYRYPDTANDRYALNNVTLDIMEGEFVAIIGHNGSGKSTIAKLSNVIMLPEGGHVVIHGMDTRDEACLWDIRQYAGMVFQNPDNQIVATIVEEDVAFGPENLGLPSDEIRRRVDESLMTVGMYEHRKKPPHLLSGGQKQRVAIAGILAMRPKCIIFDEPTAMLDPSGRKEVIETIQKLNSEGITVILITHFMDEAVKADRVIVMDKGTVHIEGTPREVFSRVEELQDMGLDVPQVTLLAHELRKEGFYFEDEILEVEDMVDALCQLL